MAEIAGHVFHGTVRFSSGARLVVPKGTTRLGSGLIPGEVFWEAGTESLLVAKTASVWDEIILSVAAGPGISVTGTGGRKTVAIDGNGIVLTTTDQNVAGTKTFAADLVFKAGTANIGTLTHTATAPRTWTLPNVNDTLVGLAATQTLTNKTLTSPTLVSPTISGTLTLVSPIISGTAAGGTTASANLTFDSTTHATKGQIRLQPTGGQVLVGTTTANAYETTGITVDQGAANNEILALKSSSVAHGVTDYAGTDTYGQAMKLNGAGGGLLFRGFTEAEAGLGLFGVSTTEVTTKGTSSGAGVVIDAALKSGASFDAHTANANLLAVSNSGSTAFLVDASGRTWQTGSIFINVGTNNFMTTGITINQAVAEDEAIALKASAVSHGMTDLAETNTYGTLKRTDPATGGLSVSGYTEITNGLLLSGYQTTSDTTQTTSSIGAVRISALRKDLGSASAVDEGGNLLTIDDAGNTCWIITSDGHSWQRGEVWATRLGLGLVSPGQVIEAQEDVDALTHVKVVNLGGSSNSAAGFKGQANVADVTLAAYSDAVTGTVFGVVASEMCTLLANGGNNGIAIGCTGTAPIRLGNGGAVRVLIDTAGKVGIGTTTVTANSQLSLVGGNIDATWNHNSGTSLTLTNTDTGNSAHASIGLATGAGGPGLDGVTLYAFGSGYAVGYPADTAALITGGTMSGGLMFAAAAAAGTIRFLTGDVDPSYERMRIDSTGKVFVGDTANTKLTVGITINQASAADEVLAFKSSNVNHSATSETENDTFGVFKKVSGGPGGLNITGLADSGSSGLLLRGYAPVPSTLKNSSASAAVMIDGTDDSGGALVATAADSNLLAVRNFETAVWVADADGDTWQSGHLRCTTAGVGASAPDPATTSVLLELSSTTGALLLTRMTSTQRDALTGVNGMVIYNTTTTKVEAYAGGAWVALH